jgi:flagellar hook protein FlgE
MLDALYSGITGLNGFQSALNTQSNNISNVNTVGFKSDNISFADQMYQNAIGRGVRIDTIDKNFTQGNIKITGGTYDLAIEGKGFFLAKGDTEEILFTRAGNFRMTEDGTLRLPNGAQVQGLPAQSTGILSSDDNFIFTANYTKFLGSQIIKTQNENVVETINSKSTDYTLTAANDDETLRGNNYKTREAKIIDIDALASAYKNELVVYSTQAFEGVAPTNQLSTIAFDTTQLDSMLDSVEITIGTKTYSQPFRENANETLKDLADAISKTKGVTASVDVNNVLSVVSMIPGAKVTVSSPIIFNGASPSFPLPTLTTAEAVVGSGRLKVEAMELALKDAIERADGKYLKLSTVVDSTDLANKTVQELQMKLDSLNISDNPFGEAEFDNGIMYLKQGDNRFVVGKIVTAMFSNELGLSPQGNNLYSATLDSGGLIFVTNENKILSKSLELSNSDLSNSLVDLMVYQRAFEANSKSVTTSDEFLKTALSLKK